MIICPILSQQRRAEDGTVTWEHHECLREGCTFWAAEAEDCAIRASGLQVLKDATAEATRETPAPPDFEKIFEAAVSRRFEEMDQRLKETADRTLSANRDLGLQLLEGVSGLEQPVNALREEMEAMKAQIKELSGVTSQAADAIDRQKARDEEWRRRESGEEAKSANKRGLALFHKGAYEAAEAAFRRAVALEPSMAEAHNNLGLALGKSGNADEAVAEFEKALELRPELAEALNNLGFLLHEKMEFEQAAEYFRRAGMAAQDSAVAYTNLGNALYRLGRRSEAVEAWKRAVEKDPLNENAMRALRMFEGMEAHA